MHALRIASIGLLINTAPKVPPSTIAAAVICATSRICPPSRTRPLRIPPKRQSQRRPSVPQSILPDQIARGRCSSLQIFYTPA